MTLNSKQQEVFTRVVIDKAPITYLVGGAGVGKTTVTAEIINALLNVEVTATTHKAKSILSQLLQRETVTIQKFMGYRLINHNYKQILVPNKDRDLSPCQLLVIDEVSLLPNNILIDILNNIGTTFQQVLFVGDPIQLPAVSNSPNLSKLDKYKIELTEQMRQSNCPILTNYMNTLRQAIKTDTIPNSLLTDAPSITIHKDHKTFCREYLKCNTNKRILAYRNNVVDKYNKYINDPDNVFNIGDKVVIDKPIPALNVNNKDILTIYSIQEKEAYYHIGLQNDNGVVYYVNHYKKVSELNQQLEKLKTLGLKKEYWALFESSFRLKHIFASTVHGAQGETIKTVFVDAFDIIAAHQQAKTRYNKPISSELMLRLLYVAISRMKIHCHIYTGDKPRNYKELQKDPYRKIRTYNTKPKEETKRWKM